MSLRCKPPYTGITGWLHLLAITLLLAGCGQHAAKAPLPLSEAAIPDDWQLKGKLGIRSSAQNGSVTIRWQQQLEQYRINVSGPFGQGAAAIEGNRQQASIEQPGKETLVSYTPEHLFNHSFGWSFPIEHLRYWVRGLQNPQHQATPTYNTDNTLATLQQAGWSLHFDRYQQQQHWMLPGRVKATRDDVALTLLIRHWTLTPPRVFAH